MTLYFDILILVVIKKNEGVAYEEKNEQSDFFSYYFRNNTI